MTFGKGRNFKEKKERETEIQQQGLTEFCLACGSLHSKTFFSTQIPSIFVKIAVCTLNTNI